jgi:hypothetical protein
MNNALDIKPSGSYFVAYLGTRAISARRTPDEARTAAEAFLARGPQPSPRRSRARLSCLECEKSFVSSAMEPTCPRCGGSDVEFA